MNETNKEKIKNEEPTEIEKMADEYYRLEFRIVGMMSELPNNGKECDCDNRIRFDIVEDDRILSYCIHCGGEILW